MENTTPGIVIPAYPSAPVQPLHFKDRRTGLIVFGILSCVIGAFSALGALAAPMALAMVRMAPATPGVPPPDLRSIAIAAIFNIGLAIFFIWVGVDSFRARRWIRPIILTVAWTWLILGVCTMVMFSFTGPHMINVMTSPAATGGGPPLPPQLRTVMIVGMMTMFGVMYLALPTAYLVFFSRRNVRATLEHYDPEPGWTDRVPIQVLGLTAGLALGAVATLVSALYGVLPVFGVVLTGAAGALALIVTAVILAAAALLTYRQQMLGWLLTTALTIIFPISFFLTLRRYSIADIYRLAGYPEETVAMMQDPSGASTRASMLVMGVLTIACLVYMAYVLKHFRSGARERITPQEQQIQAG